MKSTKGLPRLIDATNFGDLSEIITQRSNRFPTSYMDLLLLENKNRKLSEILTLFQRHYVNNLDFTTIPRIKKHIKYREEHDGWIFEHSGDPKDPVVRLVGLNGPLFRG